MSWSVYKCGRCGRPIKRGEERFISKTAYGQQCYEAMLQQQMVMEHAAANRRKRERRKPPEEI